MIANIYAHNEINPETLYRLPWTASDNAMTWLEPTRQCNMRCDACFHENDPKSRKILEQIETELRAIRVMRRCDAMLIAGGEPLTHPQILDITRMVKSYRYKPVLITNGLGLDLQMIQELKKAGLHGITFHIDSHQYRPGWEGKTERELNQLRQFYADMMREAGGLCCSYNVTVFPDTLGDVPEIVAWAAANADRVNNLSLIAVRMIDPKMPWNYFIGDRKIEIKETPYFAEIDYGCIMAEDIYREILKALPQYRFSAYIGGTAIPTSLKWVIGGHITSARNSYGNIGAKCMEMFQSIHHVFGGRYLAYTKPKLNRKGKSLLLLSVIDPEVRRAASRFFRSALKNPSILFKTLYTQMISITQPPDILPTGERDQCDGCPNGTYWEGRIVRACQLEDYLLFGAPISYAPKEK